MRQMVSTSAVFVAALAFEHVDRYGLLRYT